MQYPNLAVIALSTFFLTALASEQAHAQYERYYFKDRLPLAVDDSKIAVLSEQLQDVSSSLSQRGLHPDSTTAGPLRHWTLAELPANERDARQIPQLVRNTAQAPGLDFVSPVFVENSGDPVIVTPWIFVRFDDSISADRAEAVLTDSRAGQVVDRDYALMPGVYRLRAAAKNGIDVLDAANKLALRADVQFAEPDFIFTGHTTLIPNDAGFGNCWGLRNVGQSGGSVDFDMDCSEAWDITTGTASTKVLIMDTGVQQNHPDVNQLAGQDFTGEGTIGGGPNNACDNHGTNVAGCVSATINNGIGTVGVCPGCKSVSARIGVSSTNPCGVSFSSASSMVVNALAYAQTIGARVTNSSFTYGQSATLTNAYNNARNVNGILCFAATGNGGNGSISYPASIPSVNAVGATNRFGGRASFSQFGVGIDFSAPGQDIYTTDRTGNDGYGGGDYVFNDGTSFATPYACGVAALVLSVKPELTATQLESILSSTCVDMGTPGYDTDFGWGHLNAFNALVLALNLDTGSPTPNPEAFAVNPHPASDTTIHMQATLATDSTSPPVEYFFDYVSGSGGHDSGWQSSVDYTDTGLPANNFFNYRCKARDSASPTANETGYSATILAGTAIETPSGVSFGATDDTSIVVNADGTFTNVGFGSTGFYFEMNPPAGSGANVWVSDVTSTVTGLTPCTQYTFRVKARNLFAEETPYTSAVMHVTTGCTGCALLGDINGSGAVEGNDIAGFTHVKLGAPGVGEMPDCADYGTGTLDGDTALFVNDLLGP